MESITHQLHKEYIEMIQIQMYIITTRQGKSSCAVIHVHYNQSLTLLSKATHLLEESSKLV